jgi:hypothetical protein
MAKNLDVFLENTTEVVVPMIQEVRKCERSNYIPHKTPVLSNLDNWRDIYSEHLDNMYDIMRQKVDTSFPGLNIDWEDPMYFYAFEKLIYHCSSKYLA